MSTGAVAPDKLAAGTWTIDTSHSEVSFTIRHLGLFKVHGSFRDFRGSIVIDDDLPSSSVTVEVAMDSVDTGEPDRDKHLRSADFFDVGNHPTMHFRSTGLRLEDGGAVLVGGLTVRGVTRPLELAVEPAGVLRDPMGYLRAGFSASGTLSRNDFGVSFNVPMEGSGVVIGDKVQVSIEAQAVLQGSGPDSAQSAPDHGPG